MGYLDFGEGSGLEFVAVTEEEWLKETSLMTAASECKTVCGDNSFLLATFILVIVIFLLVLLTSFTVSVRSVSQFYSICCLCFSNGLRVVEDGA